MLSSMLDRQPNSLLQPISSSKPLLREMILNKDKLSRPDSALMELYNQQSRRPSMATRRCSEVILTNDPLKKFRNSERRKSQLSPTYKNVNFLTTEINEN